VGVIGDDLQATTTNLGDPTAPELRRLLRLPFRHVVVALTGEILEARITKGGRLLTSRTPVDEAPVDLSHDRRKRYPIPEDAPFLEALGIASGGNVKPSRRAKYRQINEFIRLLDHAPATLEGDAHRPVRVVDLGCGNAYLTFAVYHYLTAIRGLKCRVVGVDRNAGLIERNSHRARTLGWDGMRFEAGAIETFVPDTPPNIVLALHACDTATDHALAAIVQWGSNIGMVAPCCHHHLHAQLHRRAVGPSEALLLRHGVLSERLGDVITDTARATILRLLGYDVDIVEFVAPEHTPKNTLIRVSNRALPLPDALVKAYDELTKRWSVHPLLAELLRDQLVAAGLGALTVEGED
jgi:SAM-dependent methyltransferase